MESSGKLHADLVIIRYSHVLRSVFNPTRTMLVGVLVADEYRRLAVVYELW